MWQVSLDAANDAVPPDPAGRVAPKRSTGVNVRVDILYSNADRTTGRAVPGKRSMYADISLRTESATWTGIGTITTWLVYPTLPRHMPQDYHLVERWQHGVLFQFHVAGKVYQLNCASSAHRIPTPWPCLQRAASCTEAHGCAEARGCAALRR